MKKLLLLLCFLFLFFASNAQYPVTQFIGADSTLVKSRGGLQGRFAPIPFTDTAQANTSRIRQYPGALIYTSGVDKYWYRNSTMTGWVEFTSSGGATTNIYNSDGVLTGNRQLDGSGFDLRFNDLKELGIGADSSVFSITSGIFRINGLISSNDTSTYKPLGYDPITGKVVTRNSWIGGGGGGVTTIGTINGTTKSANGGVISGSTLYLQTVDATYPGLMTSAQKARLDSNSYLTIDKTYDSLAWRRNDSTFLTKSLRIQLNGSTVTPTTNDSTLSYNIVVSGGSGTVTSVATNTSTGIIGGTITNTGTISADTTLLSTRLWRQKGVDSVQANVNLKLNISDTSAMLTNYLRGSGTSLQLALFDGTRSIKGMAQYTYANSTTYPELYIGTTGTTASSIKFRNLGGTTEQINNDGGYWGFYGSSTYKNIQFYSHTGGSQIMRLYRPTTYNLIDLKGVVTASDLTVLSNTKGNIDIERTVPYANNNNYHGFTDQTIFNAQSSAFNSFGTFVTFGNDRFNQDHYAGFQTVWYKDSTNKIGKVYDFVSAVSEMRAGTIDTLYRFKVFEATKTGGTIVKQYGIQIDNLSNATTNVGAWIYNNVGIGPTAHTPSERLTVDGNILGTGTIKTADPGSGAGAWKLGTAVSSSGLTLNTTQYIEISIGGTIYKLAVVDPPTPIP